MNTRLIAVGLLACLVPLSGCGTVSFGPKPVAIPSVQGLKDYRDDVKTLTGPPAEYVGAGYGSVYKACGDYFDNLVEMQNVVGFGNDITKSVGVAGTGLSALLKNATLAQRQVTRWSTGATLISAGFDAFDKRALMTPYPSETKTLILRGLTAYEALNPPTSADTPAEAFSLVAGYAEMCSYSGVARYAKQALSNAEPRTGSAQSLSAADQGFLRAIATALGDSNAPLNIRQVALLQYHLNANPTWDQENDQAKKQRLALIAELPESLRGVFLNDSKPVLPAELPKLDAVKSLLNTFAEGNEDVRRELDAVRLSMTKAVVEVKVSTPGTKGAKTLVKETVLRLDLPSSNTGSSSTRREVRF